MSYDPPAGFGFGLRLKPPPVEPGTPNVPVPENSPPPPGLGCPNEAPVVARVDEDAAPPKVPVPKF